MELLKHSEGSSDAIPDALDWALKKKSKASDGNDYEEPRSIFFDGYDDERQPSVNDFWVRPLSQDRDSPSAKVSRTLLEILAHKRSRLFGFPLANRIVTVMLPHAVAHASGEGAEEDEWFMQPFVSFIRGGHDRGRLRGTYSLTFLLVPVVADGLLSRKMSLAEIKLMMAAGWGYAAARPETSLPKFELSGPLLDYLTHLARFDIRGMGGKASRRKDEFTLRQAIERIAFGASLSVAQGSSGSIDRRATRRLGNQVIMALGGARVSSLIVVDEGLTQNDVRRPASGPRPFPGKLSPLMRALSEPLRPPRLSDPTARKHRLDRPCVDDDLYVTGVLPAKRCLIVVSRGAGQWGSRESALMQAGSVAHMTIGAATAIGILRAIDNRLEFLDRADPKGIAEIDREIAGDLAEIYDLDIRRESYREIYRHLRERLGIARDYKTLQDKMQALYRATSTLHEVKTQARLVWLTGAIVALSVLIVIGTVVLAGKG
ncbi:MAG TPA: hypothetical protein VNS60_12120 [Solirubrobacterales bacterium]|nr:hypothetical protein [Solirubrobacterales bacterium]